MANAEHVGPYEKPAPRGRKPRKPIPKRRRSPLKTAQHAADRIGSKQVRERSDGRCEVVTGWVSPLGSVFPQHRCERNATQVHHMIGGHGKRGIGISALKEHKQHVCDQCHLDITGGIGGKRLRRIGDGVPRWTDCYERIRRAA